MVASPHRLEALSSLHGRITRDLAFRIITADRTSERTVITREEFLGGILALLEEKRGVPKKFEHIGGAG